MILILLNGKKRSGKDTAGNILANKLKNAKTFSLSSILKDMLCVFFDISREELEEKKDKEIDLGGVSISVRKAMQTLGTEWGRDTIEKSIWVKALVSKLKKENLDYAIITDIRFENEVQNFRDNFEKTILIKIDRDTGIEDGHISEQGDLDVDYTIENNGTLEELETKLLKVISSR